LLTTRRKILVENNIFFRTGMHAILIANDAASWFESGAVQDVTIRNNTFTECGYNSTPGNFVIAIAPENHELLPGYFVHRNIHIENNTFNIYDYPVLTARSVENLSFTGNKVVWTNFMRNGAKRPGFELTSCKNVKIVENRIINIDITDVQCFKMSKKDLKTDLKTTLAK